jgi:hypothetical protein
MALKLITEGDFRSSRYGQMADQIEGRLSTVIEQAESYIEAMTDRQLSRQTYTELAEVGEYSIFLNESPIIAVTSVQTRASMTSDWVTIPADYYQVWPREGVIELAHSQPRNSLAQVVYEAGYDPVPQVIKQAAILQTAYFAYQDFEIYGSGDGKEPGISYIAREVKDLLRPYMRRRVA